MSKRARAIFLAVGIAVFLFLAWNVGVDAIASSLAKVSWWFLPVLLVWGAVYMLNAAAWHSILRASSARISYLRALRITISGYALNYTTPVLHIGGEPYRALALRQTLGADTAAGTVVQHSILKYLGHGCFWALALIIVAYAASPLLALAAAGLSAAGLTAALRALGSAHKRQDRGVFHRFITGTGLWKRADSRLRGHGVTLRNIDDRTREFFGRRRAVVFLVLSLEIASRMVASLELLILFSALGQPVSYLEALIVNAGSSLILNLLFFIPYDVGSKEGSLFFLAGSVAIMPAAGVFAGIAARCRELLWILVGLLLAALEGRMETEAYPEDAMEKGATS